MFASILEVVDILILRSPIFEDLYSLELDFRIFVWSVCSSLVFRMHPHIHYTLILFLSAESRESLHHRPPPGMSRKCMCGVDDHLAWKRPVSSKTCRRLCITGGYNRSC